MEFGAHLPLIPFQGKTQTLASLVEFTATAKDLGYAFLCANDHLASSQPRLDGPTALASVLAHSGGMQVATTIYLAVVRGPAPPAKPPAAIDLLSGGRLQLGYVRPMFNEIYGVIARW